MCSEYSLHITKVICVSFFRTTRVLKKGIQMAISSIHFAPGHSGYFDHNSREAHTNNAIFKDEKNYCSANKKEAFEIFNKELKLRTEAYLENHQNRKKLHSKTITHLSAIFNFNKDTTVEQAQAVCDYLENKLDTKVVQLAMHRDEGHIIEADNEDMHDSIKVKNYHGHIEMLGLDSKGNSIRRKLDKPMLREIQTDVANILGMERGRVTSYTKEEYEKIFSYMLPKEEYATRREYNRAFGYFAKELGLYKPKKSKRLDTYEYKEMAKQRGEAVKEIQKDLKKELAKAKDLQEINKELRAELKEAAATREDYAKLEQLNKELKEKIKEKDLTIDELNLKIDEYKQNKAPKTNESILNDKSIPEKEKEVLKQFTSDLTISMQNEIKKEIVTVKTGLLKSEDKELHIINEPNGLFKGIKKAFLNQFNVLYELAKEKAKEFYKDIIKSKDTEISELKEKNKELLNSNFNKDKKIERLEEQNKVLSTGVLQQLSTKQQKENITTTPKAQTLEEILKSNPKDLKAYIKKETPARRTDIQK